MADRLKNLSEKTVSQSVHYFDYLTACKRQVDCRQSSTFSKLCYSHNNNKYTIFQQLNKINFVGGLNNTESFLEYPKCYKIEVFEEILNHVRQSQLENEQKIIYNIQHEIRWLRFEQSDRIAQLMHKDFIQSTKVSLKKIDKNTLHDAIHYQPNLQMLQDLSFNNKRIKVEKSKNEQRQKYIFFDLIQKIKGEQRFFISTIQVVEKQQQN